MDPNEDTEWNDALRKQGILPEKAPDPNEQFEEALQNAVKEAEENRLENLNLDELAELEDDEDDDFLESYRFANDLERLFDLVDKSVCKKYGNFNLKVCMEVLSPLRNQILLERSRKQASRQSIPQCKLLAVVLNDFAKKYPMLKILKIPGDQCIEGYPDRLMPTLLVYGPNEFRSQVVGLAELGGNNTRISDMERYVEKIGALTKAELRVQRGKDEDEKYSSERKGMRPSVIKQDDEDDDWD